VRSTRTAKARNHSKMRFVQRHGLNVITRELKEMARAIMSNKGVFIEKKSLRVSVFELSFRGRQVVVYYDRVRHVILTVLPPKDKE